jgi:hypothetical protein
MNWVKMRGGGKYYVLVLNAWHDHACMANHVDVIAVSNLKTMQFDLVAERMHSKIICTKNAANFQVQTLVTPSAG